MLIAMSDTLVIPGDLAACQALRVEWHQKANEREHVLVEQARAITEQSQKITSLQQQVQEQQLTISELLQRAFRHCSEQLPEHLPRYEVEAPVPDDFLVAGGFVGKLLADCYSGYQGITLRSDARIVRAACNAHARRKIFDARES